MTSKELLPCPMNNLKSSIAERVSYLRELHNESLQDVADAIGCSKTHLHELEKGKSKNPSINLLRGLAIHFMVPVAALVENEITAQYRLTRAAQEPQPVKLPHIEGLAEAVDHCEAIEKELREGNQYPKSFVMQIPARPNADSDFMFSRLFKAAREYLKRMEGE